MELADLEGFYRDAKKHYDEDEEFAERARNYVVKLQSGDEYFREMWRKLVDITMTQNQITYDRLNVTLTRDDVMGEALQPDAARNCGGSQSQRSGSRKRRGDRRIP